MLVIFYIGSLQVICTNILNYFSLQGTRAGEGEDTKKENITTPSDVITIDESEESHASDVTEQSHVSCIGICISSFTRNTYCQLLFI